MAETGFEVRTPHRGRCSSKRCCCRRLVLGSAAKQVQPMAVDATQIPAPHGHTVQIEKFEDTDSNLASAAHMVAKPGSRELAVRLSRCKTVDDFDHLRQFHAQEEVVLGDLVHL